MKNLILSFRDLFICGVVFTILLAAYALVHDYAGTAGVCFAVLAAVVLGVRWGRTLDSEQDLAIAACFGIFLSAVVGLLFAGMADNNAGASISILTLAAREAAARVSVGREEAYGSNTSKSVSLIVMVDEKEVWIDFDYFDYHGGEWHNDGCGGDNDTDNILMCLLTQDEQDKIIEGTPNQDNQNNDYIDDDVKVLLCAAFDATEAIKKDIDKIFVAAQKKHPGLVHYYYDSDCAINIRPRRKYKSVDECKKIFDAEIKHLIAEKIAEKGLHLQHHKSSNFPDTDIYRIERN